MPATARRRDHEDIKTQQEIDEENKRLAEEGHVAIRASALLPAGEPRPDRVRSVSINGYKFRVNFYRDNLICWTRCVLLEAGPVLKDRPVRLCSVQ